MGGTATLISGGEECDSTIQRILNQVFRCSHRHKSTPLTPRGEDQCYSVCLDCGKRLPQDRPLIGSPVERSSASQEAPGERAETTGKTGCKPGARERCETVTTASPAADGWRAWKLDLLWIGLFAIGLALGSLVPIKGHPAHKNGAIGLRREAQSTPSLPPGSLPNAPAMIQAQIE